MSNYYCRGKGPHARRLFVSTGSIKFIGSAPLRVFPASTMVTSERLRTVVLDHLFSEPNDILAFFSSTAYLMEDGPSAAYCQTSRMHLYS